METYGNIRTLRSADTYTTSPYGISLPYPQKCTEPRPLAKGVALHRQAQLQRGEGPRLPGTIYFWPPSERLTRISK